MQLPKDERYTYADYCARGDDERWEIIDGVPYAMVPAPSPRHQEISGEISNQLYNFLKGKPCKVYHAPFDVRLNADDYDDTVVQPDITVICDTSKIDSKACVGVPDMVIEILSPSTAQKDKAVKYLTYQRAGVREYWLVDPESKTVQVNLYDNGRYYGNVYTDADTAPVQVLEGCQIVLTDVFAE